MWDTLNGFGCPKISSLFPLGLRQSGVFYSFSLLWSQNLTVYFTLFFILLPSIRFIHSRSRIRFHDLPHYLYITTHSSWRPSSVTQTHLYCIFSLNHFYLLYYPFTLSLLRFLYIMLYYNLLSLLITPIKLKTGKGSELSSYKSKVCTEEDYRRCVEKVYFFFNRLTHFPLWKYSR